MTDAHGIPPEAEPKTPMWLPALGAALFVGVALWWAVTPSSLPIAPDDTAASASASAAPAPTAPALLPAQAVPAQAAAPMGSGRPMPSGGVHVSPAVEERLRKMHEGLLAPGGGSPRRP